MCLAATCFIHGNELRQFEQSKVQNSINTGWPRSEASVTGGEFSQAPAGSAGNSGAMTGVGASSKVPRKRETCHRACTTAQL